MTRRFVMAGGVALGAALAGGREHEEHMKRAVRLAGNVPEFPFGAVLVERKTDRVVAEGWNRSRLDPTLHGEMDVIHNCAKGNPKVDWSGLALYTTAEPCAMCMGAVAWAGIPLVVYGTSVPYLQRLGWWQIDIRAEEVQRKTKFREITLVGGVLEKECNALFDAAMRRQKAKP